MHGPDSTHDPALRCWVSAANEPGCDFPIQNLPFGRFRPHGSEPWRIGVAIGDQVLDLKLAAQLCPWSSAVSMWLEPLAAGDLNAFMALGGRPRRALRAALSAALAEGSDQGPFLELCLVPMSQAKMTLPCRIGEHAGYAIGLPRAAGGAASPAPARHWLPLARPARASALQPSGTPVRRPHGQYRLPGQADPVFGPTRQLDFGAGLGVLVAEGNRSGEPETLHEAEDDWFGLVLLDDWSARDVQAWESQPLGPLQAPAFATTVSPWVVTREALEPFRVPAPRAEELAPLPAYLDSPRNRLAGGLDIQIEVHLQGATMRERGEDPLPLSRIAVRDAASWTVAQMIAQHTAGGGRLRPGDLLGTGALSGPAAGQAASLLALGAMGGKLPQDAPRDGFLLDGDRVVIRGGCERRGARRIGFGSCDAWVEPALPWPPAAG